MFKEFKEFAMRGPVIDLAIAVVLGAAFGAIIASLVADVIMPPIGLLLGNVDFSNLFAVLKSGSVSGPYVSLAEAKEAGAVTINYGLFLMAIIRFVIIAFVIFMIVKNMNKMKRKEEAPPEEPTTKECPYCFSSIAIKATRCPNCTSNLE
ncbi:large conductance mechanosensitive channel protein MscL [bacterium]|nr:large conductance mechanosensitive channel protein MscL [bacterium]